jgi:putative NADH-flavin reductase
MKQAIKIAVIGGTGKSGKYLVKELINRGFQLKILLRNTEHHLFDNPQINNPLVEIVAGDVTNYSSVHSLIEGCQAVISTLGLGIPASEPTIFSQATANVIQAMNEHTVRRYIVTTGLNVDTPFDKKGSKTTFATEWMRTNYPISTSNKQLEFEILTESGVHWTLVRLPMIEQSDETNKINISLEDCPGDKISATDLARFLIEQLSDNTFIRKYPFIASS